METDATPTIEADLCRVRDAGLKLAAAAERIDAGRLRRLARTWSPSKLEREAGRVAGWLIAIEEIAVVLEAERQRRLDAGAVKARPHKPNPKTSGMRT